MRAEPFHGSIAAALGDPPGTGEPLEAAFEPFQSFSYWAQVGSY